jgi:hypothetical protein
MAACPLGHEQNAADHENRDNQGGADATEIKSAARDGLGKKIADRRSDRTGEDERRPEQ